MKYITPDYYEEFHCIADRCPDTCCAGWEITIDPQSIQRYQKVQGPFGNRLFNSINWKQHIFLQYDHKCIFLNEDKLCDLYTEAGANMLCQTCKQYPRHTESYLNVRELSIAISCPEVARMLLTRKESVKLITKEIEKREEIDVVFQSELFLKLNRSREIMLRILQDRTMDIYQRMGVILGMAHDLQSRMYQRDYGAMRRLIQHFDQPETLEYLHKKMESFQLQTNARFHMMKSMSKELLNLKKLDREWPNVIKQAQQLLYHQKSERYHKNLVEFHKCHPELPIQLEQLAVYFLYGYMNGSVYDGELYAKVKFAIINTLVIEELFYAAWLSDQGQLTLTKQIDLAHRYAREIEHLDDNLDRLDMIFRTKRSFFLEPMVQCLVASKTE